MLITSIPGLIRAHQRHGREVLGSASDPGGEMGEEAHQLGTPGVMVQCIVKSYNAGLQTYIVDGPGFHDKIAVDVETALNTLGSRVYAAHAPLTPVLVWAEHAQGCEHGIIIGSVAHPENFLCRHRGTLMAEGAGVGLAFDQAHRVPVRLDVKGETASDSYPMPLYDANCGRPWDTLAGDYGFINELGVGVTALKFNAGIHAGNAAVMVSYLDSLARISGDRISIESPSMEYDHFQDQGESSSIRRFTPYLWEGLGAQGPNIDPTSSLERALSPIHLGEEQLSKVDVRYWDQVGIFRFMTLEGYLGGLVHDYAMLPKGALAPVRRSDNTVWPGLYEHMVDVDGFVTVRSAKGLLFEKTVMIPVPVQKREPWDPQGDKDDDCDYGKEPYDNNKVDYVWGSEDPTSRAGRAVDHNSHRTGEVNQRALHDHNTNDGKKDWKVPQDEESAVASGTNPIAPLGTKYRADMPPVTEVDVDHRRKGIKYYPGRSFVFFGDEGSITFQDAYGSAIVMSGGNIELCPRGDLVLRPGRSIVGMAPHDTIFNAGNNAEITASKGDVRVKADRNLHMLGGNSGEGGILLEARTVDVPGSKNDFTKQGTESQSSGIILKSKSAPMAAYGSSVHIQSKSGRITIDAAAGTQNVDITGKDVWVVGKQSASLVAGVSPGSAGGEPEKASLIKVKLDEAHISAGNALARLTSGSLYLTNSATGKLDVMLDANLRVTGGIANPNEAVGLFDPTKTRMNPSIAQIKADIEEEVLRFASSWTSLETGVYNTASGYGHSTFFDNLSFSFNNSALYWASTDFMLNTTFWQIKYAEDNPTMWYQPIVKFKDRADTRPWPGNEKWTTGGFGKVVGGDFNNYNSTNDAGHTTPRLALEGAAPEEVPLEGNYIVDSQQ